MFEYSVTYPWLLGCLIVVILFVSLLKLWWYKPLTYAYPLTSLLITKGYESSDSYKKILFVIRLVLLTLMAILIAKPRMVNHQSKINGDGINIMLVLDVSHSMQLCDDPDDLRSRLEIAKAEALSFIEKREYDPIGLVIFGRDAVSRCPLTLDKNILKEIVKTTNLDTIDGRGTLLNTAIIMGANRLKDCKSGSKVMVLLTDGTPFEDTKNHEQAVAVAQKCGVKIYTIGIGQEGMVYINTPFGVQSMNGVNKELLTYIAQKTGGEYFIAKKAKDMKKIYTTIDALEKTTYETNVFYHYYDYFKPILLLVLLLALIEFIITGFIWVTL